MLFIYLNTLMYTNNYIYKRKKEGEATSHVGCCSMYLLLIMTIDQWSVYTFEDLTYQHKSIKVTAYFLWFIEPRKSGTDSINSEFFLEYKIKCCFIIDYYYWLLTINGVECVLVIGHVKSLLWKKKLLIIKTTYLRK